MHKEVVLPELGVSELHLLLLEPLTHGELRLHIFNGAFLAISEVHGVQIFHSLGQDGLVQ